MSVVLSSARGLMLKLFPRGHLAMAPENPGEQFCLYCGERHYCLDDGTWAGKRPHQI